ncbi:MAG: Rieske (2Fe-2S) protein, partial [Actinomycetota bacterium]|nr:Rieske (2Fe-2S) protein [Actinomycetota bacterium]
TVYMRGPVDNGQVTLIRPEDMAPGSMQTVFPFREADRDNEEALLEAQTAADAPVMLIRLEPGTNVRKRPGQENFNYGDYYAFSKICTHLGCPASLYDAQNHITLCPCHQSQFLITDSAKPIFGPATRALPQLPITVDDEGYFVSRGDFIEPVGPAFWEIRSH